MRNVALTCDNFTIFDDFGGPQQCINHCHNSRNCYGFTFTNGTCKIDHEMGKYTSSPGSMSGRRCSDCVPLEVSLVQGLTLDKKSGLTLHSCLALCSNKPGCSHYNFYYSKIPSDDWSRCVLVSATDRPEIINKDFVLSGARCKTLSGQKESQIVDKVTREVGMSVIGSDLKSYSNITSLDICIDICHKTEGCQAYQYVGDQGTNDWAGNICHVKYKVTEMKQTENNNQISGYSYFVCHTTKLEQNEAVGQNLKAVKCPESRDCVDICLKTEDCVGYSFSHKNRLCFVKSSLEYFTEREGFTSGHACYRPPTYSTFDVSSATTQVSQSPVMSLVLSSQPQMECDTDTDNAENVTRHKRTASLSEKMKLENPPNIDFLMNPTLQGKRKEYEQYVINKLRNFFQDRNSTKIYPNLFRLLWYTKTPCFDLFNMTGEHSHVLKYCEWAGDQVDCEHLFQAVPTDVGICCSFNFNSSLTETVYAELIRELKDKERMRRNISLADKNVLKGKVGFEMGLKVVLDSHSNIASPATINSDGNAFQVYIGNPSEFPFLRNRAVQVQPGHENHVELSGVKISADPAIHSHSLDKRKCKFYDESDLVYHGTLITLYARNS